MTYRDKRETWQVMTVSSMRSISLLQDAGVCLTIVLIHHGSARDRRDSLKRTVPPYILTYELGCSTRLTLFIHYSLGPWYYYTQDYLSMQLQYVYVKTRCDQSTYRCDTDLTELRMAGPCAIPMCSPHLRQRFHVHMLNPCRRRLYAGANTTEALRCWNEHR